MVALTATVVLSRFMLSSRASQPHALQIRETVELQNGMASEATGQACSMDDMPCAETIPLPLSQRERRTYPLLCDGTDSLPKARISWAVTSYDR